MQDTWISFLVFLEKITTNLVAENNRNVFSGVPEASSPKCAEYRPSKVSRGEPFLPISASGGPRCSLAWGGLYLEAQC